MTDYELTPEQELRYLRFCAGFQTITEVLDSTGPDWLIEGWLASSVTMVDGSPESGKSSLVASMAAVVANGESWLGQQVTTDRQGPVIIIASDPSDASNWAKQGRDLRVTDDGWEIAPFSRSSWDDYEEYAGAMRCRLLVFDNITSALDGPINEADPTAILAPLGRISTAGTPVVVIAHTGKQGGPGPMGPTAYTAWRRFGINVSGRGDNPRKIRRSGNMGSWSDVTLNGTAEGAAVEYRLADGQPKSNRSTDRLERNAEMARWIVGNCQGVGVTEVSRRIATEFGGSAGTHKTALIQGTLSKMVTRTKGGGSDHWSLIE